MPSPSVSGSMKLGSAKRRGGAGGRRPPAPVLAVVLRGPPGDAHRPAGLLEVGQAVAVDVLGAVAQDAAAGVRVAVAVVQRQRPARVVPGLVLLLEGEAVAVEVEARVGAVEGV